MDEATEEEEEERQKQKKKKKGKGEEAKRTCAMTFEIQPIVAYTTRLHSATTKNIMAKKLAFSNSTLP